MDVLNFQDAVREKAHVQLPFFHGHAVCLAGDEMQLKAGLSYSRNTHIAVGLADQCVKGEELCHWIDHPDEAISFLRKSPFAAQALEFHLSSVDGHLTLPIGTFYTAAGGGGDAVKQRVDTTVEVITTCRSCLELLLADPNLKASELCKRRCLVCETSGLVCDECTDLGYTTAETLMRPCRRCLEIKSVCQCLLPLAFSSDCASAQQVFMESLQKRFAGAKSASPMLPFPDAAHVIKCIRSSFFWWWLRLDGYFVNVRMLLVLYYDQKKEVSRKILYAVSLKELRNKDKMDVDTALELLAPPLQAALPDDPVVITVVPDNVTAKKQATGALSEPVDVVFHQSGYGFVSDAKRNRIFIVEMHCPV